jgi:hypothetical protein
VHHFAKDGFILQNHIFTSLSGNGAVPKDIANSPRVPQQHPGLPESKEGVIAPALPKVRGGATQRRNDMGEPPALSGTWWS